MAGEFKYDATNTTAIKTGDPALAKCFCEGRAALVAGAGTNPYVVGTDKHNAWDAGQTTTTPEGTKDNCCYAIPITMPTLVGETDAVAKAAVLAARLVQGRIRGTTSTVQAQVPTAGTLVQPGDTVTYDLHVVTPDLAGKTSTEAQAAILAVGLTVGTITGTSGTVDAQVDS